MEPLGGEACEGNFTSGISYALSCLKMDKLQLKAKQVEALRVVYEHRDVLFGYRRDTESLYASKYYPMYLTSSSDVLA